MEYGTKKNDEKKYLLELFHNFLKKHWVWYTIIATLPSIWFTVVLPYMGKLLRLMDDGGQFSHLGWISTAVLIVAVILVVFLNNLYLRKTETGELERMDGEIQYLSALQESVDRICEEKYTKLKSRIYEAKTTKEPRAQIISDPNNQLKRIIVGITECLVRLLSTNETPFRFRDFFVTIAYCFPQEGSEWKWTEGTAEKELDLDKLLAPNAASTFNYLLTSDKPYYFNNDKANAKREGKYLFNPQDELSNENEEITGSIFCYRYRVKVKGTVYVDAMISISTQKKRFASNNPIASKNVRDNMVSLVKDTFGKRIGIELSLLYLDYLKETDNQIS